MCQESHQLSTIEGYVPVPASMLQSTRLTMRCTHRVASTAQSPIPLAHPNMNHEHFDEEEDEFVYPGVRDSDGEAQTHPSDIHQPQVIQRSESSSAHDPLQANDDEVFVYPGSREQSISHTSSTSHSPLERTPEPEELDESTTDEQQPSSSQRFQPAPSISVTPKSHPTPAQLEALIAASSSGDLSLLQNLFRNALQTCDVEPFSLANDASTRSGLTALHVSASRGYLDVVKWRKSDIINLIISF